MLAQAHTQAGNIKDAKEILVDFTPVDDEDKRNALGMLAELSGLEKDVDALKQAANNQMSNLPGTEMVLHLIDEDIYIDVAFLSWTSGSVSSAAAKRSSETSSSTIAPAR